MAPRLQTGGPPTRILGIDPGSQRTGVGIIDVDAAGRITHVHHIALHLLGAESFPLRLKLLLDGLGAAIEEFRPHEVAIEKVFMARNPDSALKLGQARGKLARGHQYQRRMEHVRDLAGRIHVDDADPGALRTGVDAEDAGHGGLQPSNCAFE